MAEIAYIDKDFRPDALRVISAANEICAEYAAQGFDLTLRQLYYQFVSRDLIANRQSEYKRLGSIINDARLAGYLDWSYIVDRTRNVRSVGHWDDPADIIRGAARGYKIDKWADQDYHVEVWIEKDALVGVLESCCPQLDVSYFSCRGYTSQSEIWGAAQRLGRYVDDGKQCAIVHLGDHDPSGIDMTRDIHQRLAMFVAQDRLGAMPGWDMADYVAQADSWLEVQRIALNYDQVRRYNPPPNPAKLTDSRAVGYIAKHGYSSWELDALDPATLVGLIQGAVESYRDEDKWEDAVERETDERKILTATSDRWPDVAAFLSKDQ